MEWGGPRIEARGLCRLICKMAIAATQGPTSLPRLSWGGDEVRPVGLLGSGPGPAGCRAQDAQGSRWSCPGQGVTPAAGVSSPLPLPHFCPEQWRWDRKHLCRGFSLVNSRQGRGPRSAGRQQKSAEEQDLNWGQASLHAALLTPGGPLWFHYWPCTGAQAWCR